MQIFLNLNCKFHCIWLSWYLSRQCCLWEYCHMIIVKLISLIFSSHTILISKVQFLITLKKCKKSFMFCQSVFFQILPKVKKQNFSSFHFISTIALLPCNKKKKKMKTKEETKNNKQFDDDVSRLYSYSLNMNVFSSSKTQSPKPVQKFTHPKSWFAQNSRHLEFLLRLEI